MDFKGILKTRKEIKKWFENSKDIERDKMALRFLAIISPSFQNFPCLLLFQEVISPYVYGLKAGIYNVDVNGEKGTFEL